MRRVAAILALTALVATGCASSDSDLARELHSERQEIYSIVTAAEVHEQPQGSPQRTVLQLWRAVQFHDPQGALERVFPPPTPDQIENFETFVVGGAANSAERTKPLVVDARQSGRRAWVTVEFERKRKVGDEIRKEVTGRLEAELVRSSTGWRVLWRKAADELPDAVS